MTPKIIEPLKKLNRLGLISLEIIWIRIKLIFIRNDAHVPERWVRRLLELEREVDNM